MLEIYFETYGCTSNYNSTEIMKGLVKQAGLNITENIDFADLIIINSCIVKEPTQEKIRRKIQDLLNSNKKIILAGCMPRLNQDSLQHNNLYLLDTSRVKELQSLINDIQNNNYDQDRYLTKRNEIKLGLPKVSRHKHISVNQISEGCKGDCSYCIVKLAKGDLFSYPEEQILESIRKDLEAGCKEIWVTSQDNASYGNEDGEYRLPKLLEKILELKGNFFVRVGMMNPNNVLKILPELIELYKHPKMFKFLHLPIQSASDNILKKMKRNYSVKDISKIINKFQKEIPEIMIATDIIVGFPGETENEFQESFDLIQEIKPEILNISKFWPRKGTKAYELEQVPPELKVERAKKLSKLHLEICNENQKKWKDWKGKVLVDQKGFGNTYLARNSSYKLFAVQSRENILGKKINIQVKQLMPHYLISVPALPN